MTSLFDLLMRTLWNAARTRLGGRGPSARVETVAPLREGVALGKIVRSPYSPPAPPDAPAVLALSPEERRRHMYLLGATGSGKTNLLRQLVQHDIENGRGICLIDARGELVDQVLLTLASLYTPEELEGRLLLIDLREDAFFVPVNPLMESAADAYTRVGFLMALVKAMFELGPQTEQLLRNALLALALTTERCALTDLEPLLTVPSFRAQVLGSVKDVSVRRFFARFEQLPSQSSWVEPCLNKWSPWLSRPALRNVLGQHRTISFHDLLDARSDVIVLVSLSADTLFGDAHLMGSLIIHSLISATMRPSRRDRKGNEVNLYLDEFENFDGLSDQFASILAEGRKFGLGACLSHQTSIQLNPKLRLLIRNIVGTQIFFSVGGNEAETLSGEIASDEPKAVIRNLLMSQKAGDAVVVRRGEPFIRIRTRLVRDPSVSVERIAAVRLAALRHFGTSRETVESELALRDAELGDVATAPVPAGRSPRATKRSAAPLPAQKPPELEVRDASETTVGKVRRRKQSPPPAG